MYYLKYSYYLNLPPLCLVAENFGNPIIFKILCIFLYTPHKYLFHILVRTQLYLTPVLFVSTNSNHKENKKEEKKNSNY